MGRLNAETNDRFWTMLQHVSKSGSVIAASPYVTDHVHVNRENIEEKMGIEIPKRPVKRCWHSDIH